MRLHYFYDPLCGWCYGAAPLIAAARERFAVIAHGGGMMTGAQRQQVTPALRDYVIAHDRRIAAMTGQPFDAAYFDGLLNDREAWFDSMPPIAAILAADRVAGRGLEMLASVQRAHYVEGRCIADEAVLHKLAEALGLDAVGFARAWAEVDVSEHVARTRRLLAACGGRGFPTLALEHDGRRSLIDVGAWLGRVDAWRDWLAELASSASLPGGAAVTQCRVDGGC